MKHRRLSYSLLSKLMASPTAPMPLAKASHQLSVMHLAMRELERAEAPTPNDWRIVSDAINLMETLVTMGHVQDASGLLRDAIAAMAVAGARHVDEGKPIRLTGEGIQAVRGVLEDYAEALRQLPERVLIECHRMTERRMQDILAGRGQAHDVTILKVMPLAETEKGNDGLQEHV